MVPQQQYAGRSVGAVGWSPLVTTPVKDGQYQNTALSGAYGRLTDPSLAEAWPRPSGKTAQSSPATVTSSASARMS
jgi:hypothetical protein